MLGGRSLETENKSGRGRLRNLSSHRLRERFWNSIWPEKQNGYLQSGCLREVVAYEKWSLWESWLYSKRSLAHYLLLRK